MIEDQDTIFELTSKIQKSQSEIFCMNDSRNSQDAESGTQWTIPRYQSTSVFSHLIQILVECLAVLKECRAAKMGRQVFGTHMVYRETFLQIQRRHHQHLIRKSRVLGSHVSERTSPHLISESQTTVQDQRCQSEDFQRIMRQTNNDCRFQILILTNSPRQQRSLVGR